MTQLEDLVLDNDLSDSENVEEGGSNNYINSEQIYIQPRINPDIPDVTQLDLLGWNTIWKVGVWKAFLNRFPLLESVPEQHKEAWCLAWTESLTKWQEATSDFEKNTSLIWMSFWAQALLRKPARGGRAGRNEVASRFKCVTDGDWSRLINYWEKDLSKLEEKQVIKKNSPLSKDEANDYMKLSRVVIGLIEAANLVKLWVE